MELSKFSHAYGHSIYFSTRHLTDFAEGAKNAAKSAVLFLNKDWIRDHADETSTMVNDSGTLYESRAEDRRRVRGDDFCQTSEKATRACRKCKVTR